MNKCVYCDAVTKICFLLFISRLCTSARDATWQELKSPTTFIDAENCPKGCQCTINEYEAVTVSCNDMGLENIPHTLRNDTTVLLLRNNRIEFGSLNVLKHQTALQILDLNNNNINDSHCCSSHIPLENDVKRNTTDHSQNTTIQTQCIFTDLPESLKHIHLRDNALRCIDINCMFNNSHKQLVSLDISINRVSSINPASTILNSSLRELNVSGNLLTQILLNSLLHNFENLQILDLSNNILEALGGDSNDELFNYSTFKSSLQVLDVHNNQISTLDSAWFSKMTKLEVLILNTNHLVIIPANVFSNSTNLIQLDLSHMPKLKYIDQDAFSGLNNLHTLILSHNNELSYLHSGITRHLTSLRVLDISYNSLHTLYDDLLSPLQSLETLYINNNTWTCDCDIKWLLDLNNISTPTIAPAIHNLSYKYNTSALLHLTNIIRPEDILCFQPDEYRYIYLKDILFSNWTCSNVTLASTRQRSQFHIGSEATLNCDTDGDPSPHTTWVTPAGEHFKQDPRYISLHHTPNADEEIQKQHNNRDRIRVLSNGSLHINYITRNDVGHYECTAYNPHGNITIRVPLRLDAVFRHCVDISFAVGLCSAICFMLIGIIVAVLRYVAFKCSREQREKRKSIRQIVSSLAEYRSERYDRFSAYRMAKIDQFSTFKNEKVKKMKNVKNLTVTSLVNYLHQTQENYTLQIQNLRENCTDQANHLRDNYANQLGKIRDYRSEKIERIRENYQGQANKIKDYGASQLEKLRDQYHLQQQHALKILEIMNIGNCMTMIESECTMRTDSLIFDDDLFDMDNVYHKCPFTTVQMLHTADSTPSMYQTAGSDIDLTKTSEPLTSDTKISSNKECATNRKRVRHQQTKPTDEQESPLSPPRKPCHLRKKKRPHRKRHPTQQKTLLIRDDSVHYMGDTEEFQTDTIFPPQPSSVISTTDVIVDGDSVIADNASMIKDTVQYKDDEKTVSDNTESFV